MFIRTESGRDRPEAQPDSLENEPLTEDKVIAEVERYIAISGQALAYKIGQLKILEFRHKSERELGAKFNIRDVQDEVLKDGALRWTLTDLNEWLAGQRQAKPTTAP